ncbi:uncharacterized protein LOC116203527 isoform X1 [Punica granatum]|uniref:Uncharacterized protein LOC116203527 isoform X1 n=1 Tax=Punica granatum TaxID=22663 RepID=A0A6P8DCC8_PUNGR|nr:uncharacterized protein LOC116203527 isoform X1 [Punica granatum]
MPDYYINCLPTMETEDVLELPIESPSGNEGKEPCESSAKLEEVNALPCSDMEDEEGLIREDLDQSEGKVENEERPCALDSGLNKDLAGEPSTVKMNVELIESIEVSERSAVVTGNGFVALEDHGHKTTHVRDGNSVAGAKRARITYEEEQPSVHVVYKSLTRASKQKLEELLQQWSEWHTRHIPSAQDPREALEFGEQTVFPALHVGEEKQSAVSFWIDLQAKKSQSNEFVSLDGNSVPLYDRGYGFSLTEGDGSSNAEGGLEIMEDAARCFNCGSYSHSLRDCPRPRDNVAVNNARKEHKSKKILNAASRSSTRYYESPSAGKFDGLKPGTLDAETRKLLGLGELDPPPWLNRMRELGYPPGYLDIDDDDDDDQQSGIMIFADGETKPEKQHEDGEIPDEPRRKKSVAFPGINAPIPEDADERLWSAGPSRSDFSSRYRMHHRSSFSSEQTISRSYRSSDHNTCWSTHSRDDYSPNMSSRSIPTPSPTSASGGRFQSEWSSGRWSSRDSEDHRMRGPSYDSLPHSYPSSRSFDRDRFEGPWGNEPRESRDLDYGHVGRDESRRSYSWR